jgi:hypothetical protein
LTRVGRKRRDRVIGVGAQISLRLKDQVSLSAIVVLLKVK